LFLQLFPTFMVECTVSLPVMSDFFVVRPLLLLPLFAVVSTAAAVAALVLLWLRILCAATDGCTPPFLPLRCC
jgi:hypothetical protein